MNDSLCFYFTSIELISLLLRVNILPISPGTVLELIFVFYKFFFSWILAKSKNRKRNKWMMYRIHRVLKDLSKKWAFWDFLLHFSKMLKDPSFLQSKRKKLIWNLINLRTFLFCLFTNDERWKKPNASILGVDAVKLELAHRFPHFCLQFTNGIRNGIRNNFWSNFFP